MRTNKTKRQEMEHQKTNYFKWIKKLKDMTDIINSLKQTYNLTSKKQNPD